MNSNFRNLLICLALGMLAALLFWPLPSDPFEKEWEEEWEEGGNKLEAKSQPNDFFALRHAFPDNVPDVAAYSKAMKITRNRMAQRSQVLPGFDEPWVLRGPGDAGARVNSIAIHPNNDQIMLAGFSAGGIFKTTNGGNTWTPVFDQHPYLAIGYIHFDPIHPDTIYAGTGDPNITSYPFIGDGLFRSVDGGDTWTNIGLEEEGIISKIAIDPTNTQTIYVATMGLPFARSNRRGLYKTIDGGQNWNQILQLSDSTGVIDLMLNPQNPQIIYAAGWDRIRNNSESIVNGNGARIHRSMDGGNTWTQLGNGLPTGNLSRIGMAMSGNNPNHIFALYVDLNYNIQGLYKSIDGGNNWTTLPTDQSTGMQPNSLGGFGWYFGQLRVDPNNETNMYILGVQLWASNSGGTSWYMLSQLAGSAPPHVDHHDLAFTSTGDLILATDGGLYRKPAGVNAWSDIENIPATQFYRIGYNPNQPNAYYGGTQDNGTQLGFRGEVTDWEMIFGGDGFQPVFHPTNPDIYFVETQNGLIWATTDGGITFQYGSNGLESSEPRSWDMQYIISPHNPNILYTGTDRLYISTTGGIPNWTPISGILAAPDGVTADRYHVLTTLSESPLDSALMYVGTSDAKVRRRNSSDGLWVDITPGLPNRYVTDVVASPDNANVVYVSHSGYKDGELIPHLHRSDNQGATWVDISSDLPPLGVNDLFILPNNNGQVLFAGTDGGVYATLDGGQHWERLGLGMPLVPVYDMAYNDLYNELMAGTHARSIFSFPLDSIGVSSIPSPTIAISGSILKENGQGVNAVDISGGQATTQADGTYEYEAFTGVNCEVKPLKNTNARNGLSVLDLVLIQRHLLFIDTLDSPYKIIAADVNKSKNLTVTDLVLIQRMILFIDTEFSNNTSWRFVPSDYVFTNPLRPLQETFPESYDCGNDNADLTGINFVAIKVGDVSGNASVNAQSSGSDRLVNGALDLTYTDRQLEAGAEEEVLVSAHSDQAIFGLQMVLQSQEEALEILEIISGTESEILPGEFQTRITDDQKIRLVWTEATGALRGAEMPLFRIRLRAKQSGLLSEMLQLDVEELQQAVIGNAHDVAAITIEWTANNLTATNTVLDQKEGAMEISPNPFTSKVQLKASVEKSGRGIIRILDLQGKVIWSDAVNLQNGDNTFELGAELFPAKGLYYWSMEIAGQKTQVSPLLYQ